MKKQIKNFVYMKLDGEVYSLYLYINKDTLELETGYIRKDYKMGGCPEITIMNKAGLFELRRLIYEATDKFTDLELGRKVK